MGIERFQVAVNDVMAWCEQHQKATAVIIALVVGLIAGAIFL